MKTRRTTISDCVTDMVPELAGDAQPLPEIARFAARLAQHLQVSSVAAISGGIEPQGLAETGLNQIGIDGDLSDALVLCSGCLERAESAEGVLDQLSAALEKAPAAILTSDARGLVDPEAKPDPTIRQRWSVTELEALLHERDLPVQHVALTLTDSHGHNRDTTLVVLGREELGLRELLVTGTWNLAFHQAPENFITEDRPARICIATNEVFGPALCGGIGTAYTSLIESLASAGHDVTILFNNFVEIEDEEHWQNYYKERNVEFVALDIEPLYHVIPWQHEWMRRAHKTYTWLRDQATNRPWDVIHFPECNGLGYYTIQAKHQGLAFPGTTMCVGTHGSTRWANGSNGMAYESLLHLAEDHMERRCVEAADVLVGPSRYLLKWMEDRGWALPEQTFQQQYIQPQVARTEERAGSPDPEPIKGFNEIVFFGRLETRKGLVNTCDALDRPDFAERLVKDGIKVTFLGRAGNVDGVLADEYLKRRGAGWEFEWEQISDRNQKEAVAYLQGPGRLILIPSTVDNSPNTVYECMGLGVAMITARSGGIPELIDPRDVAQSTFFHEEEVFRDKPLAEAVLNALDNGLVPARPATPQEPNEKLHLDWHASLAIDHAKVEFPPADVPKVSVLICALRDAPFAEQALESLKAQSIGTFELILALDERYPERADAVEQSIKDQSNWRAIRVDMLRPGLVKNELAAEASNDTLIFMEADAVAMPEQLETLANVHAQTGSDVVSSFLHRVDADAEITADTEIPVQTFFPLGGAPALPIYFPFPGAQTFLITRSAFDKVGGFAKDHRIDVDDCELLVAAMIAGFEYEIVPDELFWSRQPAILPPGGTSDYASSRRTLRPYLQNVPEHARWLASYSRGLDQLHEKRMKEYWEYKYEAERRHDAADNGERVAAEFDDYFKWAQAEMEGIKEHLGEQVESQREKTEAAKSKLNEAKVRIKELESRLKEAEAASTKKRGFFRR